MPIHYAPDQIPTVPSDLAHQANTTARHAADARASLETRRRQIDEAVRHPLYQRIQQAIQGPQFLLYNVLGLFAFPGAVLWEAMISRRIYELILPIPSLWWVPILVFAVVGMWASAQLGEAFSEFRLRTISDTELDRERNLARAVNDLYDQRNRTRMDSRTWRVLAGLVLAVVILAVIYYFSDQRVQYLRRQDKPTGLLDVYLPVLLYGFEILLGIPMYFVAICYSKQMGLRRLNDELTRLTFTRNQTRQAAVEQYTGYLQACNSYNAWADQRRQSRAPLIPASVELRRIFREELGYDPMTRIPGLHAESRPESSTSSHGDGEPGVSSNGTSPRAEEVRRAEAPPAGAQDQQAPSDGSREADLLRLIDEHIASQNGRF